MSVAEAEKEAAHIKLELMRRQNPTLWLAMTQHRNTKSRPMDFVSRPELIALYSDQSPDIVFQKCVQCGISEYLICDSFSHAENGLSVFYILPTAGVKQRFVQNRIDSVFLKVPYYAELKKTSMGISDNLTLKHYGNGVLLFCGSNTPVDFIEFPADMKVIDERDRCDQGNLSMADDRMSASEYKISREAGNPTVLNFGINESFTESDQKHYHFKCGSCGTWQTPNWFEHVVREIADGVFELRDLQHIVCSKCEKPIDRTNGGCWVAHSPGASRSGYQISKLISPWHDIATLFKKFEKALRNDTDMQVFYNSDLGIPYSGVGVEVSDELLNRLCGKFFLDMNPTPNRQTPVTTCGIDVGKKLHVVIRDLEEPRVARLIAEFMMFEEVTPLLDKYNVISVVVDQRPEAREAMKFREAAGEERVWLCDYLKDSGPGERWDENNGFVRVDRTFSLDGIFGSHGDVARGDKAMVNPQNAQSLCGGAYYAQMKSLARIYNPDRNAFVYVERGADHFAHAENYCKLATKAPDTSYGGGVY